MTGEPTTWRSGPTPACATEEMIEAGVRQLRKEGLTNMPTSVVRLVVSIAVNAALKASPKPIENDPEAKDVSDD